MINFTFNLLDRFGVLERAYVFVSNTVNRHILKRHTLNTELIADSFRAVDGFWLKHGRTKWYGESEIRVIVGSIVESLRDNQLDAKEVRAAVNFITAKWKPEVAEAKASAEVGVLIPAPVENNALRAVEVFKQIPAGKVDPADFVALGSRAIAENMPDNTVVNGVLGFLGLKK
jgi:hypothetical protein